MSVSSENPEFPVIRVSLRDLLCETKGMCVSLEDILSGKYPSVRYPDYIEVNVVHSFIVRTRKPTEVDCKFIFADRTCHISAVFRSYRRSDEEEPEVYQKLKVSNVFRICNFVVETENLEQWRDKGESTYLLRNQVRRIKLSNYPHDITYVALDELEISRRFLKDIPFQFTEFDDVDINLAGKLIDIVSFVEHIEYGREVEKGIFQRRLKLSKAPSDPESSTDTHLFLTVYEHLTDHFLTNSVYTFSNIKVKYEPMYNIRLHTTAESIIIEGNQLELRNGIENLSRTFSQLSCPDVDPTTQIELTLPPQPTTIMSNTLLQPLPLVSQTNSGNSSKKRGPPTMGSASPTKKSCQSSPHKGILPLTNKCIKNLNNSPESEDEILTPEELYDCVNGGLLYEVNVKLAKTWKDTKPGETYKMRSTVRGMALIINNTFTGTSYERIGSDHDVRKLKEFLSQSGFEVVIKTDLTSWELKSAITEFKNQISEKGIHNVDSIFVAILSHGEMGFVEMTDENVYLFKDIIHPFDECSYKDFQGKPKIFVVQTCQTLKSYRKVFTSPEVMPTDLKNTIVCYGAYPGKPSYRNTLLGTYMIYILVHVMMRRSHDTHFEKMLRLVQEKMAKIKYDLNDELICSWTPYHFKKMYFNPGLVEKFDNIDAKV